MIERNSNFSVNWSKYILTSLRNTHSRDSPREARRRDARMCRRLCRIATSVRHRSVDDRVVGKNVEKNQRNEPIATRLNAKRLHDAPSRTSSTIQLVRDKYIERQQRRRIFQKSWKKKKKRKQKDRVLVSINNK